MLGFCAVLFMYMLGLLIWTAQLGAGYSLLKWIVIGVLVAGSAALLTWQVSQVRRLRDEQSPRQGHEVSGSEGDLSEPGPQAVRVEFRRRIFRRTDTATCPPLPDGGTYGAPGQG